MHVDGALGESCGLRDFRNIQVLDVTEKEDGSLLLGQGSGRFPYRADLVVHDRPLFRREAVVGPFPDFIAWDVLGLLPELKPSPARMILVSGLLRSG
jgi:hypothetical protein